jgi:hypothetical protein
VPVMSSANAVPTEKPIARRGEPRSHLMMQSYRSCRVALGHSPATDMPDKCRNEPRAVTCEYPCPRFAAKRRVPINDDTCVMPVF